jgi:hypothetical protein
MDEGLNALWIKLFLFSKNELQSGCRLVPVDSSEKRLPGNQGSKGAPGLSFR